MDLSEPPSNDFSSDNESSFHKIQEFIEEVMKFGKTEDLVQHSTENICSTTKLDRDLEEIRENIKDDSKSVQALICLERNLCNDESFVTTIQRKEEPSIKNGQSEVTEKTEFESNETVDQKTDKINKQINLSDLKEVEIVLVKSDTNDRFYLETASTTAKTAINTNETELLEEIKTKRKRKKSKDDEDPLKIEEELCDKLLTDVEVVLIDCNPKHYFYDEMDETQEANQEMPEVPLRMSKRTRRGTLKIREMESNEEEERKIQYTSRYKTAKKKKRDRCSLDQLLNIRKDLEDKRKTTSGKRQSNEEKKLRERIRKRQKRQNINFKEREREKDRIRRRLKRADITYKIQERVRDRERKRNKRNLQRLKELLELATNDENS